MSKSSTKDQEPTQVAVALAMWKAEFAEEYDCIPTAKEEVLWLDGWQKGYAARSELATKFPVARG